MMAAQRGGSCVGRARRRGGLSLESGAIGDGDTTSAACVNVSKRRPAAARRHLGRLLAGYVIAGPRGDPTAPAPVAATRNARLVGPQLQEVLGRELGSPFSEDIGVYPFRATRVEDGEDSPERPAMRRMRPCHKLDRSDYLYEARRAADKGSSGAYKYNWAYVGRHASLIVTLSDLGSSAEKGGYDQSGRSWAVCSVLPVPRSSASTRPVAVICLARVGRLVVVGLGDATGRAYAGVLGAAAFVMIM